MRLMGLEANYPKPHQTGLSQADREARKYPYLLRAVSTDGRGRAFHNIFVERLWGSVKYEDLYIHDYQTLGEVRLGLRRYFHSYNHQRVHQALDYRTPMEVYGANEADTLGETRAAAGRGLFPQKSRPATALG